MKTNKALATIALGVDSKGLPKELNDARKKLRSFFTDVRKGAGFDTKKRTAGERVGGMGRSLVGGIAGGAAFAGASMLGGGIMDVAADVVAFEKALTRFQIAGDKSTAAIAQFRTQINAVSRETGVAREEVLAGASAYVAATGDANGAATAMATFAKVSKATGTAMADVANVAAALKTNLQIDPKDYEAAFSALAAEGKAGAVELKDLAAELSNLAPSFAAFKGGHGVDAIRDLGAAIQTVKLNAGSVETARTKFISFTNALKDPKVAKGLARIGVKTRDANNKLLGFNEIVEQVVKNDKLGDDFKLAGIFKDKEARDTVTALRQHATEWRNIRAAAADATVIQRDYNVEAMSSGGKIERAMNAAKMSLVEAFTPERIEAFAKALGKVAEWFAKIVGYVEELEKRMPHNQAEKMATGLFDARAEEEADQIRKRVGPRSQYASDAAYKAALGKEALALEAAPKSGMWRNTTTGTMAARKLAADAGILLQESDPWARNQEESAIGRRIGGAGDLAGLEKRIADAIERGLARVGPKTIQMDGNKVGRVAADANRHNLGKD